MDYGHIVEQIARCHEYAQAQAASAVNVALTIRNWLAGAHIVEYEQHGEDRAKYGSSAAPDFGEGLEAEGLQGAVAQQPQELSPVCACVPESGKKPGSAWLFGSDEDSCLNPARSTSG